MFDRAALSAAVARRGRVARVVIAAIAGSSPREVGTAMLVWADTNVGGQSGTIGGGALEYAAAQAARDALARGHGAGGHGAGGHGDGDPKNTATPKDTVAPNNTASNVDNDTVTQHPLGPALGQCCGGSVTLLTEIYDAARLALVPENGVYARGTGAKPMAIARAETTLRNSGNLPDAALHGRWFIEPMLMPNRHIWIWGAGHVGRALVDVLAPLPEIAITWVDTTRSRFPDVIPAAVTVIPTAHPAALMPHAPKTAHHLILTYSHALDLALCHAALAHGFASAGLIGSATKWARFRSRLGALGHSDNQIARIICPIGDPNLGKHPHAIAVGVAAWHLNRAQQQTTTRKNHA